ncbi:olfactory receptor 8S1-like [Pantherophis guttatus]|uniref:Olfactory receptor n=1 Tax=Pantherophis guttatus TaxID=94885 RepID=A0A6P9C827_PANGU|nr:olfactory receptor 8S1-like [Pantherophis guttatus]
MENQTEIKEFILLGLSKDPHLQDFLFVLFLIIFLVTLLGNMMIILVTRIEFTLQTPMFFFLRHLAFVDICYSSVTVPKLLGNLITKKKTISWEGCIAQNFFLFQTVCAEVFILSAMAYDRYVAICDPLHYTINMTKETCRLLVGTSWGMGFLYGMANVLPLLNVHFCSDNIIRHYSCELPSLLALSCTKNIINYIVLLISGCSVCVYSIIIILVSYIYIISTILNLNLSEAKRKTFSTCSSHLMIVILYYSTGCLRNLRPRTTSSVIVDELFSVQYNTSTPMLNPIIYSLKAWEVKEAIKKLMGYKPLASHMA